MTERDSTTNKAFFSVEKSTGVLEKYNSNYLNADRDVRIPKSFYGAPLKVIGAGAFKNCTEITSVEIPRSVVKISREAFKGCVKLKRVVMHDGLRYIQDEAFADCPDLEEIIVPKSVLSLSKYTFIRSQHFDESMQKDRQPCLCGVC